MTKLPIDSLDISVFSEASNRGTEESLRLLANDIERNGQRNPIQVQLNKFGLHCIHGSRRLAALQLLRNRIIKEEQLGSPLMDVKVEVFLCTDEEVHLIPLSH